MYSNAQHQPYHRSSCAFDPALGQPENRYLPSIYPPSAMQSQHSEAPPPYAKVVFPSQSPQRYQNDQVAYSSRMSSQTERNQFNSYELSPFGSPYPAEHENNFPETKSFPQTPQPDSPYYQNELANDFNGLRVQDDVYHTGYAIIPDGPSRQSPIPAQSQYNDSRYPHTQPSRTHKATPSTTSNESDTPSEQQILHQALAFAQGARAPPPNSIPPLRLPVAIPQTIPGGGQAFTRAWVPSLSSHGITATEFLAFIDGLNIVSTASPPLQVMNLAGSLLGMVPYHWANIAGFAIQATAQLGTVAVSKGRTEMYMKEANEKFFVPRKLKVAIASRDAVGAVLRLPREQPILAPLTRDTMSLGMLERSLAVMRGYAADLDFNVPPPAEQTTLLAKMSAKQIERQGKKNEKKMLKEREKTLEKEEKEKEKTLEKEEKSRMKGLEKQGKERGRQRKYSGSDSDSEDDKGVKSKRELKREQSRERKERRKERKAQKEAEKKHGKKSKDKEAEKAGKLLWILIENL